MNRGQIGTRVLKIIERGDSEANTLVDEWITEVVRKVEDSYPFPYLKKTQKTTLTADEGVYTLPTDLILHHPYMFKVESIPTANTFKSLVKIGESTYHLNFTDTDATADVPDYYHLSGGANGLEFVFSRTPLKAQDLHLAGGYFYTDLDEWNEADDSGGTKTNWLTDNRQDLVISGVAAKGFEFYEEQGKAQAQFALYRLELNGDRTKGIPGLVGDTKRTNYNGRQLRVRLAYDQPNTNKSRVLGY